MNMKSVALVAALAGIAFGCSSSTDPDKVRCKSDADCTAAGGKAVCEGGYCAVEACTEGYADCDQQYSNGCEVDLGADSEHCGDCATACGSHSFCDAKACACEKGYGDCNGIVSDGCETVTDTDAENCGKCGNVCPAVTNGKGGCNKGKCGVGECDRGWGDCDGKPETGCEYNVSNDVNNCGGCGDTCGGVIGADVTCKDNGCTWACKDGYGDCDDKPETGCETDISANVEHCGECNNPCPAFANAETSCRGSKCEIGNCNEGYRDCDGQPENGCEWNLSEKCAGLCGGSDGCGGTCPDSCVAPETCGGGGTPNVCGCKPKCDGKCGGPDGCGGECVSTCVAPQTCGGGGTQFVCGCTSENDTDFCKRLGKNCGTVTATEANCGVQHSVKCGSCNVPQTCGGGGTENVCGCTPNCTGKCGGPDGCGGVCPNTCIAPQTCGGGGTANLCGCTPKCSGKCGGPDSCGGTCPNNCVAPQTCGGGGTQYVCGCTSTICGGNCPDNCILPQTCGGGGLQYQCGCTANCAGKCSGPDGCGGTCPDTCSVPLTCGGGGTQYVCGCTPYCTGKCGDSNGCGGMCPDNCVAPQTCGGGGTQYTCGCTFEGNAMFCSRLGKNCDNVTANDNCGTPRTVNCGTCLIPQTCGGGGSQNVCGCTFEGNTTFCSRLGMNCDNVTATDNCGTVRTVNCGTCTSPQTCGGSGTQGVCGCAPNCTGKCSGSDGCTGICPDNCALPQTCGGGGMQYICGCTLNCTGDCTDGCGGLCPDPCTAFLASAGSDHTCSVTPNGGVKCWGGNINGQLGNGTSTSSSTLVPTTGLASGTYAVSAGGAFTCALLSSGGVRCWGSNFSGQLGDGTKTSRTTPVDVIGLASGAYEVAPASGGSHVCALLTNGGVQCWGSGQSTPVYITGMTSGVSAVATGSGHTCAILTAGDVKCWGVNFYGQLGDGTTTSSSTPVNVIGLASGVVAVAAGGNHTCALLTAGGVKCWGNNSGGQLGDGTTSSSPTPVSVTGLASAVIGISTGGSHTCALLNYGGVRCWGGNSSGQLGDGTTTSSAMPVDVTDLTSDVRLVSAGASHTCAVMTSGGVKCWGSNYRGQLGDGNTVDKLTPTSVLGFGQ